MEKKSLFIFVILGLICFTTCDKKHSQPITIDEDDIPDTPINIIAQVGDGRITLTWDMEDTAIIYCYLVYRKDSLNSSSSVIDSSFVKQYTDANVRNNILYTYQISALNNKGYEGKPSNEVRARPNVFDILIKNGDDYTNSKTVTLQLTATLQTQYMLIANDSLFNHASWESFASFRNWNLTSGDGEKHVYAKFKDNESNETQQFVSDAIVLDTKATIYYVQENTLGNVKQPGDTIHFKLNAAEPDGRATIDIAAAAQNILLYDDGTNGDSVAADGLYEVNYQIPSGLEVINATVTGYFTDRVDNIANNVTAAKRITIQQAPAAVTLFPPAASGTSARFLELYWTESTELNFSSYRLFKSKLTGVDTSSSLLTTISNISTTSFIDEDIKDTTNNYYRIFVYDKYGLSKGSNEVAGKISHNEPPTPVVLNLPSPLGNSFNSLSLSWSINEDNDFASYRIYRAQSSGVDLTSVLVATISDQDITNYEDNQLKEDTAYYYCVYIFDSGGLSAASNEVTGRTLSNEPPTPVTLYPPYPISGILNGLRLNWSLNNDDDFSNYKIYRSATANIDSTSYLVTILSDQFTTDYEDTDLEYDSTYYYRIYVFDTAGNTSRSNIVSGKTNANPPPAAVTLAIPAVMDSTTLSLSWSRNRDDDFATYSIYRSLVSFVVADTLAPIAIINTQDETQYQDFHLTPNTDYYYRVMVTDNGGLKSVSNEVKGTPNP